MRKGLLSDRICEVSTKMQQYLYGIERTLQEFHVKFTRPDSCSRCHREMPIGAKKCHPCRNTSLLSQECTNTYRVARFFTILQCCGFWPSPEIFRTESPSKLAHRLQQLKLDNIHFCTGGVHCPRTGKTIQSSSKDLG